MGHCLSSTTAGEFTSLHHIFIGESCWLKLRNGETFGCFSSRVSRSLKRLVAFPCIEMDILVQTSSLDTARSKWKRSGKPTEVLVNVNIYGHDHAARDVGDCLANLRLFLQIPLYDERSSPYENPQYLKLPGVEHINLDSPAPITPDQAHQESREVSRSEIETLLDHIPQPNFLREVFTNPRTITLLKKWVSGPKSHARANMSRHQSEAVDFTLETTCLPQWILLVSRMCNRDCESQLKVKTQLQTCHHWSEEWRDG
jgi:hypothetical protein